MKETHKQKARELLRLSGEAQSVLKEALAKLDSAGNWGLLDIFGGGFLSTMLKHNRIDEARALLRQAQEKMRRLSEEIFAAPDELSFDGGPGGFATFADFFCDGLLSDLYVQGKIRDMQSDVRRALEELRRVDRALNDMLADEGERL